MQKTIYILIFPFLALLVSFIIYKSEPKSNQEFKTYATILGIAQDAGYPHPHCDKSCCQFVISGKESKEYVNCLGIIDKLEEKVFMIEATPDFTVQEAALRKHLKDSTSQMSGILISHAHIGHYTGLMYLGREAMGAKSMPVFVMPRMKEFLETNGPWSQLVKLKNIAIESLQNNQSKFLTNSIQVKPIQVPHRDEYSETIGFIIQGSKKKILFIPDIDKWAKWELDIQKMIAEVDIALIDGTFYKNGEIPNRDMSEIPHPFMEETMKLFENSNVTSKIYFIHINHTNPVLRNSKERQEVIDKGFHIAEMNQQFEL